VKKVAIIEYGMGNLHSVARAVEECGGTPIISDRRADVEDAASVILPGVGSFAAGMRNIRERGLDELLVRHVLERGIPFLGVCLGMQLMAARGEEGGDTAGLGWIDGEVRRLRPDAPGVRLPHVGWNNVLYDGLPCPLLKGIPSGKDFYFVHSFALTCRRQEDFLARTPYCGGFASVIGRGRAFGVQFHPEKSQRAGFQLLKNFLDL